MLTEFYSFLESRGKMKKIIRKIEVTWEESRTIEINSQRTDMQHREGDQKGDAPDEPADEESGEFNQITSELDQYLHR